MKDAVALAYEEGVSDGIKITHQRYQYLVEKMLSYKSLAEQTDFAVKIIQ